MPKAVTLNNDFKAKSCNFSNNCGFWSNFFLSKVSWQFYTKISWNQRDFDLTEIFINYQLNQSIGKQHLTTTNHTSPSTIAVNSCAFEFFKILSISKPQSWIDVIIKRRSSRFNFSDRLFLKNNLIFLKKYREFIAHCHSVLFSRISSYLKNFPWNQIQNFLVTTFTNNSLAAAASRPPTILGVFGQR